MRVHEVPTAILLRKTALKASVGNDPIDRRPGSGGHLGRAIPHGTGITLAHRTDTRWAAVAHKAAGRSWQTWTGGLFSTVRCPCPSRSQLALVVVRLQPGTC